MGLEVVAREDLRGRDLTTCNKSSKIHTASPLSRARGYFLTSCARMRQCWSLDPQRLTSTAVGDIEEDRIGDNDVATIMC